MKELAPDWRETEPPVIDEKPSLPPIMDAADFVAKELPAPEELVKGILHRGSKLVLGGGSKSFKTWTLLDLALSVSHGCDWLGFPTTRRRVLYLNFEIQPWCWQQRIQAVAQARGIALGSGALSIWNLRGHAQEYTALLPQVREAARTDYALIILDPAYKLYGGTDENKAGDIARLLNEIEALCVETGAATAFGAHFSKGNQASKESIDRISGSGVFARDPDSLLIFTKHEIQDAFTVESTLRNFKPVEAFVVRWRYPLMVPDGNLDPAKLKQAGGRPKKHDQADLLALLGEQQLTTTEWQQAAKRELGMSSSTFYSLKKELQQLGRILQSKVSNKWQKLGT